MFTIAEIVEATGGAVAVGEAAGEVSGVSTDSRLAKPGELFVPLRGERFDGHNFLGSVWDRGVRVTLAEKRWLEEGNLPAGGCCIAVDDTLRALGDLASYHRRRFDLPVVGVTGSNGKTTTKEMLAAILSVGGEGLKTEGNLNNLIGVPQMLFRLTAAHRWAVLEMGMSEFGEIDRLAEIARPDVGVITNAYPAHLETLGSVEGVAKAKGELFLRLQPGGCAVFNAADQLIARCPSPEGVRRISFGLWNADVTAEAIEGLGIGGQRFMLRLPDAAVPVTLRAFGRHNVANALAAAAAAHVLGISAETIARGLGEFHPYARRFNLEEVAGVVLVDDSYNANPASMAAALTTLREIADGHRSVAVLGDMLELGEGAEEAHRQLGRLAATCVDRLYLLGPMAGVVAAGAREGGMAEGSLVIAASHEEIVQDLRRTVGANEFILVKGSRGMAMDRVAEGVRTMETTTCGKGGPT
ncbi:UDP-N-acetylmuramoyl-tripeptide--D-alanyl-D-alanine ligase [Geobacter pickeringii]|uniref:UDP-N-acetylmuramoyl-tripeptide--D-alanyl-D-alanine ligase n=1 Tax=Geobacter pickeringii TaxID=345632 RepID=A0A0B5BBM6_9BACT|nr:UDP-N-acetylmuramoyl-tripeptide--D-alanyl-D-alanine ligase [Geobacter pickeringii]AJE02369.1 UDP-N-acetylmuramoylalanyl-D-glutamyl-2, 6-diaminopimelate--D-alanyl-D-alanine ligase [Geobacter pickeringii]